MTFRSNKLGHGLDHGIFFQQQSYIGHTGGPCDDEEHHEGCFPFRPMKSAFSIFRVPKPDFFVRQLLKPHFKSWAQHPT
jgi:hypothetical protein